MREDLLHFIWKYRKLQLADLRTSNNESLSIIDSGLHNHLSGPDFFNAKVRIDNQLWAGNVEIHLNSSDWYLHRHEKDSNYDSVILHVVWSDDASIYRKDGSEIPTIALKNYISKTLLQSYQELFNKKQKTFINCEKNLDTTDTFVIQNWLERMYFERLENKSAFIFELLERSKNDWEQVLFTLLLKNFGLKINGEAFLSLSNHLEFATIRKLRLETQQLESVFYGMSHLLDDETILDFYHIKLKKEYEYLKRKFSLNNVGVMKPEFFKLRPPNFPTIRLSQIANLYGVHESIFDKVIKSDKIEELYVLFDVSASPYWNDHFTFGKSSKKSTKKLSKSFIDLLIINTILPLKFCYAKHFGNDVNETIVKVITEIASEKNSIISSFKKHSLVSNNAKESQALIQLYNNYCTKNKCLDCAIGSSMLS